MRHFDESVCRNLDVASRREWRETNGISGYASATISGLNTRSLLPSLPASCCSGGKPR